MERLAIVQEVTGLTYEQIRAAYPSVSAIEARSGRVYAVVGYAELSKEMLLEALFVPADRLLGAGGC